MGIERRELQQVKREHADLPVVEAAEPLVDLLPQIQRVKIAQEDGFERFDSSGLLQPVSDSVQVKKQRQQALRAWNADEIR